jgi:sec-independent protein translocase protein TatC
MSFGDHLEDLRRRLIWALAGVAAISVATCYYGRFIVLWLCQPLIESQRQLGLPQQTINLTVAGGFMVYVKVSLLAGLVIGAPWVVYQLWLFVRPGLHRSERRFVLILGPLSAAMSLLSIVFMYYLFLPAAISFLLMFSVSFPPAGGESPSSLQWVTRECNGINSYFVPGGWRKEGAGGGSEKTLAGKPPGAPEAATRPALAQVPVLDHDPAHPAEGEMWINRGQAEMRTVLGGQVRVMELTPTSLLQPQIEINQYLSMVMVTALILLISFQLPVVMALGGAMGILSPRTLARYRRYVIFGCFVIGVFATPNQDFVSNIVFPLLLWGLFELGLVMMRVLGARGEAQSQ